MLPLITQAVESLRKAFPDSNVVAEGDGSGGAYVVIERVALGDKFTPPITWVGGHVSVQFPYADIYPIFIGAEVRRVSGEPFVAPVTGGHTFRGRAALQVSRRTNRLDPQLQTAPAKFQKVLYWLTH